jgi:serine/threonine protein kinase
MGGLVVDLVETEGLSRSSEREASAAGIGIQGGRQARTLPSLTPPAAAWPLADLEPTVAILEPAESSQGENGAVVQGHHHLVGQRLGRYEVVGALGAGGMGEVYRARDLDLGREVAIKTLPPALAFDSRRRSRLETEGRLLAALNHPNIASIYGFERSEAAPVLVLELIDGETLAERISRGPVPTEEACGWLLEIAQAVEAAHARGIIHRDLKPSNIMITALGHVKLLDFGLGKSVHAPTPVEAALPSSFAPIHSITGLLLGTPPYMSPEQARGQEIDGRSDIWSFGCVTYEVLTGRAAFPGETFDEIVDKVLEREPAWDALPARTPKPLRDLLRRCLEKDPEKRLPDLGEACSVLLELGPVSARKRWSAH